MFTCSVAACDTKSHAESSLGPLGSAPSLPGIGHPLPNCLLPI